MAPSLPTCVARCSRVTRSLRKRSITSKNEENFRRSANPLKGSVSSLRGAMELRLKPALEINQIAGPYTRCTGLSSTY
uniref:Uncharacterized protein n=2 Tax=Culex quinquefasciatus TaxID=7176 RepID=A0A1S4KHS5_CULQU